ncbi:MAG: hypothetical protein AB7S48_09370 [Bacteroidales bacterium]
MRPRLNSSVFDLPVQELRRGYRSDIYFWREKIVLERNNIHPNVIMQVFQKQDSILCGIDEAISVLKVASGRYSDYQKAYYLFDKLIELKKLSREIFLNDKSRYLKLMEEKILLSQQLDDLWIDGFDSIQIDALWDGDSISSYEPVMHIKGDASLFAHLETIYLGILARRTKIATNVRRVVAAAKGKTVLYFPARFDHWAVQGGDGYAAHIGGASGISTDAQGEWWGANASGTIPHALIAAVGGNTVKAVELFGETYPETPLIALVDFENDCVATSLNCAKALGERLWGVRLDTSENLVDKSVFHHQGTFRPTGVNPKLVELVRNALDSAGFNHVKIVVSGGFNPERIAIFEQIGVPVDAYGVGSYLMQGNYDFTADIVQVDGDQISKVGRTLNSNPRFERIVNFN